MPKRRLALIMIVTLLISGWSQAAMVASHIASMQCRHMVGKAVSGAVVTAPRQAEVDAMPCHQYADHQAEGVLPASGGGSGGDFGMADESGDDRRYCEDCAGCAAACSASGVISSVSLSCLLRQSGLVCSDAVNRVSLTLPLPDRPPIFS